jgi:hypothetical protein
VQEVDMEDGIDRYKYFMRFLLEGRIVPSLKALRVRVHSSRGCDCFNATYARSPPHSVEQENLSGRPSLITMPTATQHKILAFLHTLSSNKIYNKRTLLAKLYVRLLPLIAHLALTGDGMGNSKAQPKFLLAEMKLWVNLQTHELLEQLWSKLGHESVTKP